MQNYIADEHTHHTCTERISICNSAIKTLHSKVAEVAFQVVPCALLLNLLDVACHCWCWTHFGLRLIATVMLTGCDNISQCDIVKYSNSYCMPQVTLRQQSGNLTAPNIMHASTHVVHGCHAFYLSVIAHFGTDQCDSVHSEHHVNGYKGIKRVD